MAVLSVRVPKINSCCFCVSLRTAALSLSLLGITSHLYTAFLISSMPTQNSTAYLLWVIYSYITAAIFAGGSFGIWKHKVKIIKIFAISYWIDLALGFILSISFAIKAFHLEKSVCSELNNSPDTSINTDTCHQFYNNAALAVLVALGLSLVIKVHYSLAVWSYYKQITSTRSYAYVEPDDSDKLYYEMDHE
ncbi:hypothetical protein K7432_016402 [Basidiobolus ranarum]|uniref:Uncharacterized protein n=1 Tax=Basidiobolus ranarum TaxID=34480 RepID=A0ABR2WET0_9FUNG